MPAMLITGGAGFIGSAVARAALEYGFETYLVWRHKPPIVDTHAHQLDLTDVSAIGGLVGELQPQVVVHAAAGRHRPLSTQDLVTSWRDSVMTTVNLLEACRGTDLRFVHIASSHEFEPSDHPHRETDPLAPVSSRGAMKLAALVAVRQWARETGKPTVVVRPFSVYGPGQPEHQLIPTLLRCTREGLPFAIPASITRRDFVYLDDVVRGILAAATLPQAVGGEFNLATGVAASVAEVVDLVEGLTGRKVIIAPGEFPHTPGDRPHWAGDSSLAREVLGWSATVDLRRGLQLTLEALE